MLRNSIITLFVFFLTFSAYSHEDHVIVCHYDGDEFHVILDDKHFVLDVDNNASGDCVETNKLAAFYDGDELYVFNSETMRFQNQEVDNVDNVSLGAKGNIVALYDGDELYIYDGKNQTFKNQEVDNEDPDNVGLATSRNMVAFYDQDEFYVYDLEERRFFNQEADNVDNFDIMAANRIAFLYDQDEIYYVCRGQKYNFEFDDNVDLVFQKRGRRNGLKFGHERESYFISSKSCKLTSF